MIVYTANLIGTRYDMICGDGDVNECEKVKGKGASLSG